MQGHIAQHQTKITEEQLKKVGSETCDALEQLNNYYREMAEILVGYDGSDVEQKTEQLKYAVHDVVKWDDATVTDNYAGDMLVTEDEVEELSGQEQVEAARVRRQELQRLTEELQNAFARETTDLSLYFDVHNQERRGSPYDDVDGPFFVVTGYYEKSDGAQALEDLAGELEDVTYVEFV